MATLYSEQSKNVRKTWFLMTMFAGIVVLIGWFVSYYYGNPSILTFAIIFAVLMNVVSYWKSDKIALSLARAVPAKREEHLELFQIAENLSITAGIPMPRLYIINDPAPNAFATGRNKEHAAVAVTTGLLNIMDKNELSGVIAHEFSHITNRDILLQSVVVVLVGFIAIIGNSFMHMHMFGGRRRESGGNAGNILMIVGVVFMILSPIIAQLIQLAISRKREFLADSSGALLTRFPEGLASALQKISAYGQPLQTANNATAHMYISNPFGVKAKQGISKLFMTHPPVQERVNALLGTKDQIS
ncbi:MAG: M48 family metallopeptidase [bacterium]|nr:M48 family metallopeptidase [bacterium]